MLVVPRPPAGQSYVTQANSLFMCAGCGQNDATSGYAYGPVTINM